MNKPDYLIKAYRLYQMAHNRYEKAKERYNDAVKRHQDECNHKGMSFNSDPSGNNDSFYDCSKCGLESRRNQDKTL